MLKKHFLSVIIFLFISLSVLISSAVFADAKSDDVDNSKIQTMANIQQGKEILHLDFNEDINDSSPSNITPSLVGVSKDDVLHDGYLDLSSKNGYLSIPGTLLSNLQEFTVSMRVMTDPRNNSGSSPYRAYWAFYSAPNGNAPTYLQEKYLGIILNGEDSTNAMVSRFANNGSRPTQNITDWTAEIWHDVKVVFNASSTLLYIDGDLKSSVSSSYSIASCIGNSSSDNSRVIYLGYAPWEGGQYFNGKIDDITIYSGGVIDALDDDVIDAHIVTDRVTDPDGTTVNLFDYWIDSETTNDYQSITSWDYMMRGINTGHPLLFGGYWGSSTRFSDSTNDNSVGNWNTYTGDGSSWPSNVMNFYPDNENDTAFKPRSGIVARNTVDGYPALDITSSKFRGGGTLLNYITSRGSDTEDSLRSQKLDYLFDPEKTHDGKKSFTDVDGMFRIDSEGYYYFDSQETFAELNREQTGTKENSQDNHITLFDKTWSTKAEDGTGEFFPFNHWNQLFTTSSSDPSGIVRKNAGLEAQNNSGEELINHWFGMSMNTRFQQPVDGVINRGSSNSLPMKFEFSGDDDIWIFIDGVLVGDLGGIHRSTKIEIDFSTGDIKYFGDVEGIANVSGVENGAAADHVRTGIEVSHLKTTIKEQFTLAGSEDKVAWRNDDETFANGSIHTLSFYYLERGHDLSNNSLRFNLEPVLDNHIRKFDENGHNLDDAVFDIYEAELKSGVGAKEYYVADDFVKKSKILENVSSKKDGSGQYIFEDRYGTRLDFSNYGDGSYFLIDESTVPTGYRSNPYIICQYHSQTSTLTVENKYETGAYASFMANWRQIYPLTNTTYDVSSGDIEEGATTYTNDELDTGLVIVVPAVKEYDENDTFIRWLPMYGSNVQSWNTIYDSYQAGSPSKEHLEMDLVLAAFLQIADGDAQDWYLTYDNNEQRLKGFMKNLPGDATRYTINDPSGDLTLLSLYIPESALIKLGLKTSDNYANDNERFEELKNILVDKLDVLDELHAKTLLDSMNFNKESNPFEVVYTQDFQRNYATAIFVPNEQRELRVRKVNDQGNTLNGVVFAIFDNVEDAQKYDSNRVRFASTEDALSKLQASYDSGHCESFGATATVALETSEEHQNGMIIFREKIPEDKTEKDGYGQISWPKDSASSEYDELWLKEIYAPQGYKICDNLVKIEVGDKGIYANATGYDLDGNILSGAEREFDQISVYAALGKLDQTLVKYAVDNHVDKTLSDITITKEDQASVSGDISHDRWMKTSDTFDLHYNLNSQFLTGQYGLHGDGGYPLFRAENGYVRVMPTQTQNPPKDSLHNTTTHKDVLVENGQPIELDALFDLMNIVEISDPVYPAVLAVSKTAKGSGIEEGESFSFKIKLEDVVGGEDVEGTYHAYIHETGHKVRTEDGTSMRACKEADHNEDTDNLYLNQDGEGTFSVQPNQEYVICGLPQGAYYEITETPVEKDGYESSVSIQVDGRDTNVDSSNPYFVSGNLNTSLLGEFPDLVHVHYTNIIKALGEIIPDPVPEDVYVEMPAAGGYPPINMNLLGGSLVLSSVLLFFASRKYIRRKREKR